MLDLTDIRSPGMRVLNVACGVGVLLPDYPARGALSATGVNFSPA